MFFIIFLIIIIVLWLNRDSLFVRKLWNYLIIIFNLAVCYIQKGINYLKKKIFKNTSNRITTSEVQKETDLENEINDLKEQWEDVDKVTKIEVTIIERGNKQLMDQFKEIKKMKDREERNRRLSSLVNDFQ